MPFRYQVVRKSVRLGKMTYRKGDYMPESFRERDIYKVLYPSRLKRVEVPMEALIQQTEVPTIGSNPIIPGVNTPIDTAQAVSGVNNLSAQAKPATTQTKPVTSGLSGVASPAKNKVVTPGKVVTPLASPIKATGASTSGQT